jgi:hypothetical protein
MASSPTIEDRLESIEAKISKIQIDALSEQVARLAAMLEDIRDKKPTKEFYGVAEVAAMVGRSEYQVREWCKSGRIRAEKRSCGHGPHKEWAIPHAELTSYQSLGLRPGRAV